VPAVVGDCFHHQTSAPDPAKHSPIYCSRPVLPLPWEFSFKIQVIEMAGITGEIILKYIELGGQMIGVGTNRGQYGKFDIVSYNELS
jgi:hypothetical protein